MDTSAEEVLPDAGEQEMCNLHSWEGNSNVKK